MIRAATLLVLAMAMAIGVQIGCASLASRAAAAVIPPPPAPIVAPKHETDAQAELRQLRQYRDEVSAKIKTQEQVIADEDWAWARSICKWLTAALLVLSVLTAIAAVYFRSATLAGLVLAGLGGAVAGMFSDWLLYHRVAAVAGLAVLGGGFLAYVTWQAHRRGVGLKGAIQVAESLKPEPHLESDAEKALRLAMQSDAAGKATAVINQFRKRMGLA